MKICEFKFKVDGKMYVCGYDVYIIILMGVVKLLNEYKNEFLGIVKLLFELVEEIIGGVLDMII